MESTIDDGYRYSRQTILPEIGEEGQERLRRARVLCVGVGGLGSPAALYLAAAGVGRLGLIDGDRVDGSNLQRQILFTEADVGRAKAVAARERLGALNSRIEAISHDEPLDAGNAERIIAGYDVVVDGSDNFETKYLVNDVAAAHGIAVVFGSLSRFEGQVAVFRAGAGPCYRCLYPEPPRAAIPNCAEAGILGAVAGTIGSLQALEATKLVLEREALPTLTGRLLVLDGATLEVRVLRVRARPGCAICATAGRDAGATPRAPEVASAPRLLPRSIGADELRRGLQGARWQLIDLRGDAEWQVGRIPGAISWPLAQLERDEAAPSLALDRPVVLYCRSGLVSGRAGALLAARGFTEVLSLDRGFRNWTGPLESDAPAASAAPR